MFSLKLLDWSLTFQCRFSECQRIMWAFVLYIDCTNDSFIILILTYFFTNDTFSNPFNPLQIGRNAGKALSLAHFTISIDISCNSNQFTVPFRNERPAQIAYWSKRCIKLDVDRVKPQKMLWVPILTVANTWLFSHGTNHAIFGYQILCICNTLLEFDGSHSSVLQGLCKLWKCFICDASKAHCNDFRFSISW